jgi:hypothetical protein
VLKVCCARSFAAIVVSCFVDDSPSGGQGVEGVLLARSFAAIVLSCFVNDSPSRKVICFGDVPA